MAGEIISWNISGIKCKLSVNYHDKIQTLSSLFENVNSTFILNIQESHIFKKEELPTILPLYEHMFEYIISNAKINDPYAGIILCIRKTEEIVSK
jgi:exonuclease III